MTLTTLVTGPSAAAREAAIAAAIDPGRKTALILEGLPDGSAGAALPGSDAAVPNLRLARIAPGCPCCTGNLTMRVTLNRILRHPPERLYISLATSAHHAQIRRFLSDEPYDKWLTLTEDMSA